MGSYIVNATVRRTSFDDANFLAELAARTFRDMASAETRNEDIELYISAVYGPARQQSEIIDPRVDTLLVEMNGKLAGFAQLRSGPPPLELKDCKCMELWRFYVDRPGHGCGVAQSLMTESLRTALLRQADFSWLSAWEQNARAKAFYTRWHFKTIGRRIFWVGTDAQEDCIMARELRCENAFEQSS